MKILEPCFYEDHDILPMKQFGADKFGKFKYNILPGVVITESFDEKELKKGWYDVSFDIKSFYHGISKGITYHIGNLKITDNVFSNWTALKLIWEVAGTTNSSLKDIILADDFEGDSCRVTKELDNGTLAFAIWTANEPYTFSINLWGYEGVENRNELIKPINDLAEDFARKVGYPPLYQDNNGNHVVIPSIPHPLRSTARGLWLKSEKYRSRLVEFEDTMKKVLHSPKLINL